MKTQLKKIKEYSTFEEFIETFYPSMDLKVDVNEKNPIDAGRSVARSSLAKHGHLLPQKSSKLRPKVA